MLNRVVSFLVLHLANVLSKWLGKPIDRFFGFDKAVRLLKLGFTGVTVQFRNLRLLQGWNGVLLRAGLPFQIRIGVIEHVTVHVGFFSAITVDASGVYLVTRTTTEKYYDAEEEQKQELAKKRKRLKEFGQDGSNSADEETKGWVGRQVQKLVNGTFHVIFKRLTVSVRSVHVRLEDDVSGGDRLLVAGAAIEQLLVANSTAMASRSGVEKALDVTRLSVYWNCASEADLLSTSVDSKALLTKMKAFPFTDAMGYDYLLRPMSLKAWLELTRTRSHSVVGLEVSCPDPVVAVVSQDQLVLLVSLLSFIKHQNNIRHIAKFRPSEAPGKSSTREWWLFAYQSVVFYLREKRGRRIWDIMLKRSLGKEYCDLYMKFLMPIKLTRPEKIRMQELEDEMDLLGVMVCRSKVWRELKLRRLVVDLAKYSSEKTEEEVFKSKTDKVSPLAAKFAFRCSGVQFQLLDEDKNHNRPILGLCGDQINASFSQWPHLSFGASMGSLSLTGCGQTGQQQPGPVILQCVRQNSSSNAGNSGSSGSSDSNPPMLEVKFSQPSSQSSGAGSSSSKGRVRQSYGQSTGGLVASHAVRVSLEQTILVVDTKTVLQVIRVSRTLLHHSSSEFEKSLREQSYNLMWKGKKRVEVVLTSRELFSVTADIKLPIVVLPRHSHRPRHEAMLLNPGHLTVATTTMHIEKSNLPAIQYNAKLIGTSISLSPHERNWEKLAVGVARKSLKELVTCKEAFGKMIALVKVLPDRISIPKMEVLGNVPLVRLAASEDTVETLLVEASSYVDVISAASRSSSSVVREQQSRRELFHSCSISQADQLTDCHVMEITDQVQNRSTSVSSACKQAMESGLQPRSSSTLVHLTVDISKVLVDICAQEGSRGEMQSLHAEMNLVSIKFEHSSDSMKTQLDIGNIAVDNTTPGAAAARILSTHYNETGRFLSIGVCLADSSMYLPFVNDHQLTKLKAYVELAPLDLSFSDTWLSSWCGIGVANYLQLSAISFTSIQSAIASRPAKQTSKTIEKELQVKQSEVSKGIVALSFSIFMKEVSVAYIRRGSPVARLAMCGIGAEVRDSIVLVECSGSVDSISLINPLQNSEADNRVIFSNDLERVLKFKYKKKTPLPSLKRPKKAMLQTFSRPIMDPDNINVNQSADITVGGVSFHLLSKFIFALQESLLDLQHNLTNNLQPLLAALAKSSSERPDERRQEPWKYHLSVNVHTVSLTVPERAGSDEMLEACLESLLLSNKYNIVELSGEGGASYYPLGEVFQLDFHQLSVSRRDEEDAYRLVRMPDASITLSRVISKGIPHHALASEPHFKISFVSPKFEFDTTNVDISAALKIIQRNLKGAQASSVVFRHAAEDLEKDVERLALHVQSQGQDSAEEEEDGHSSSADEPPKTHHHRSLLQLDADISSLEWHATYITAEEVKKTGDGFVPFGSHPSVTLATRLALDNLFSSLSVQSDKTFSAEVWLMDISLKEVTYSANRRRSSSYDNHQLGMSSESYILHHNLYYRKTKPPRFGGGTMDTRRSSSKDVVLQTSLSYSDQEMKVQVMLQHLHVCLQSPILTQCLKILADLSSPPQNFGSREDRQLGREEVKDEEEKERGDVLREARAEDGDRSSSSFGLDIQFQLDHSSVALSDKPSEVVSYGMCAEISSTAGAGPAHLGLYHSSSRTRVSAEPLAFSVSLVQFGSSMVKVGQVIEPCNVVATYTLGKSGEGQWEELVNVTLSELVLSLTMEAMFSFIRPVSLILRYQSMSRKDSMENIFPQKTPWKMVKIDEDTASSYLLSRSSSTNIRKPVPRLFKKKQKASIKMENVVIYFDIIFAGSSSSVLTASTMLEVAASSWSSQLEVDGHVELCSHVYNRRSGAWEPFLEPVENPVLGEFKRWGLDIKARFLSAKEVESAGAQIRQMGSTSSSQSEEESGTESGERRASASKALNAAMAPLIKSRHREGTPGSVTSGDGGGVGALPRRDGEGDTDSVFESEPGGQASGGNNERRRQAFVLIVTSDDRLEFTLTPGAVETLYKFEKALKLSETEMAKNLTRCSFMDQVPLQIRNETGLELNIYPGPTFAVGSQLFDNTVQMVPTRRSFSSPAPLAAVPVPPGAMKLSSSGSSSENLLPPVTVLDASSLSSGRRSSTPSGSVTVNSWLVNLLYSARSPRGSSARISLRGVASLKKTKLTSEESPDGEDAEDNMEDVKDYLFLSEDMDREETDETADSLAILQQALNEKRKRRAELEGEGASDTTDCADDCRDSISASHWLPKSLHHQIRVQAKGGMKSSPLAVSVPGLTFVPLYDFSFGNSDRKGSTGSAKEVKYGRKMLGVCEVSDESGMRVVTIRSALQIKNEFPQMISMYDQADNGTHLLYEINSGEVYNPPVAFFASRNPLKLGIGHCGLFGEDVLDWGRMLTDPSPVYISCPSGLSLNQNRIYIQVLMSTQSVVTPVGTLDKPFHLLTFKPALVIHNLLPMKLSIRLDASDCDKRDEDCKSGVTVAPGKMENLFHVDPTCENRFNIEIDSYRGVRWKGAFTPDHKHTRNFYSMVKLYTYNNAGEKIDKMKFGLYSDSSLPSIHRLYCPYWVVNATTLKLEYEHQVSKRFGRSSKVLDSHEVDSVTLIYFKNDLDKKDRKIKIRMKGTSQWSKNISLESAGQSENIVVKSREKSYELTVHDSTLMNLLTRVVRIHPSVTIRNATKVGLQVGTWSDDRISAHTCVTIEPEDVRMFWPDGRRKEVALRMRDVSGQWMTASNPFKLTTIGTVVLATSAEDELPAVTVEVSADKVGSALFVTILPYVEGSAPYCIKNLSSTHSVRFRQKSCQKELLLPPGWQQVYTWEFPLMKHVLEWQVKGEVEDDWTAVTEKGSRITSLQCSEDVAITNGTSCEIYWNTTYNGTQRVLQVYDDLSQYNRVLKATSFDRVLSRVTLDSSGDGGSGGDTEEGSFYLYCSLEGVGLSLLNNRPQEVLYCSVTNSPAVWLKRTKSSSKFRVLHDEQLLETENAWRSGSDKVDIDSESFNLSTLRGSRGSMLTRTFNPGIWVTLSISEDHMVMGASLGRVQVDNQLRHYVLKNRIVFAPERIWNPEKATAPLVMSEVVVHRPSARQPALIVKNAYIKVQDLQMNLELGVVASIFPLVDVILAYDVKSHLFAFKGPLELVSASPKMPVTVSSQSTLFHSLSISPFRVVVAYSTINEGQDDLGVVLGSVVETLLAVIPIFSHGSVTVSLDSLKFQSETGSASQLYQSIYGHYKHEILSQFYSVFLGLDVIGNPSKLFGNFELGIKDLIEETEKGFEKDRTAAGVVGVAVGVKELLGHVVEGSAGSLLSTAGSFRTSLLQTTDLEYKRKHRQLQHEASESLIANISLGARFFVEGIIGGITSIFVQPIAGARKSGTEGFLKGVGKGALSVLTKPTLGVVDLAYFTLEGIRSSVDDDISEQTIRLPRLIYPDKVTRPYKHHDAQGLHILWHNDESEGTQYYAHHFLPSDDVKSAVLLLVNSARILKLKKSYKSFKLDDLCIKLKYLQEWDVHIDANKSVALHLKYGEDSVKEKIGSFFGINPGDHNAEVTRQTSIELDSASTGKVLVSKITEACEGLLLHYGTLYGTP